MSLQCLRDQNDLLKEENSALASRCSLLEANALDVQRRLDRLEKFLDLPEQPRGKRTNSGDSNEEGRSLKRNAPFEDEDEEWDICR